MSQPRIDQVRIRKLCEFAEKLGHRVMHIHADIIRDPAHARIKIQFQ